MKIFLIGLPGCGKSTLGKQLAEKLKVPFVDLDSEIEKSLGIPIKDIFKKYGETFFRKEESEQLHKFGEGVEDFVMATGGGVPVFFDNMKFMNQYGRTVFLDVPASEIAQRIRKTKLDERPLLGSTHPEELKDQIEFLRSQRISFYQQAHIRLVNETIQLSDIFNALSDKP
jgi:shikimate kinase